MNGKQQAIDKITDFLESDEKGMLITGTHQYEKHSLIIELLKKHYKDARILFRINAMEHITDNNFISLRKQPKAGEQVIFKNNNYSFDSFKSTTWSKTSGNFDFAIVYPIDALCREKKFEPIEELRCCRNIGKLFLCTWTDSKENDYTLLSEYYQRHIIYDVEEEDPAYHQRVLDMMEDEYYD